MQLNWRACSPGAQVIYTSSPDPLLLERFDPLAVTFQLTAAPQHGKLTVAGQTSPVAAGTACAAPMRLHHVRRMCSRLRINKMGHDIWFMQRIALLLSPALKDLIQQMA